MDVVKDCIGCRLALSKDIVYPLYQNDAINCILDTDPFNDGHVLILPKAHIVNFTELDPQLRNIVFDAVKKFSSILEEVFHADGITVCHNSGIFNALGHYHVHVIPRYKDDGFLWCDSKHNKESTSLQHTQNRIIQFLQNKDLK